MLIHDNIVFTSSSEIIQKKSDMQGFTGSKRSTDKRGLWERKVIRGLTFAQ